LNFGVLKTAFSSDKSLLQSIKNIFGFYPNNLFLYKLAFLHKSSSQENSRGIRIDNERLEYLGDAVLDCIIADYLFRKFPYKDEGFLTEMRSKIVSRSQLIRLAQKIGMDNLIRIDTSSGNAYRSFAGDAFEALIGAIYLDRGYKFTKKILLKRIIEVHLDIDQLENLEINYKSKLIELAQREKKQLRFLVVEEVGTGYRKQYIVDAEIEDKVIARGQDYSIKGAEQNAAEKAYHALVDPPVA